MSRRWAPDRQLVGEGLEQEHGRRQLRAQGVLQLFCWYCWACAPSALPQQPSCRICRRLPAGREKGGPGQGSRPSLRRGAGGAFFDATWN
jgi:hypothetical protein